MVTAPDLAASEGSSLTVRDVSKTFRAADGCAVPVLDRLSLTVAAGEMAALVGPSGCGKSTLLRLIAGLDAPTAGELRVGATPITGPGAERGLVFQDPSLFPWLTVRGNIESGWSRAACCDGSAARWTSSWPLVGLDGFGDAYPHQLSGGMAQRAALARAPSITPSPAARRAARLLDAFTRMRMQDEVLRLWQARGTTMLLVTHDIDEAVYMSDRIVLLTPRPAGSSASSMSPWSGRGTATAPASCDCGRRSWRRSTSPDTPRSRAKQTLVTKGKQDSADRETASERERGGRESFLSAEGN